MNIFILAWDLKLANIVLGLSAHGGRFSCLYCEGLKNTLDPGLLRTFGSLGNFLEYFFQDVETIFRI